MLKNCSLIAVLSLIIAVVLFTSGCDELKKRHLSHFDNPQKQEPDIKIRHQPQINVPESNPSPADPKDGKLSHLNLSDAKNSSTTIDNYKSVILKIEYPQDYNIQVKLINPPTEEPPKELSPTSDLSPSQPDLSPFKPDLSPSTPDAAVSAPIKTTDSDKISETPQTNSDKSMQGKSMPVKSMPDISTPDNSDKSNSDEEKRPAVNTDSLAPPHSTSEDSPKIQPQNQPESKAENQPEIKSDSPSSLLPQNTPENKPIPENPASSPIINTPEFPKPDSEHLQPTPTVIVPETEVTVPEKSPVDVPIGNNPALVSPPDTNLTPIPVIPVESSDDIAPTNDAPLVIPNAYYPLRYK